MPWNISISWNLFHAWFTSWQHNKTKVPSSLPTRLKFELTKKILSSCLSPLNDSNLRTSWIRYPKPIKCALEVIKISNYREIASNEQWQDFFPFACSEELERIWKQERRLWLKEGRCCYLGGRPIEPFRLRRVFEMLMTWGVFHAVEVIIGFVRDLLGWKNWINWVYWVRNRRAECDTLKKVVFWMW